MVTLLLGLIFSAMFISFLFFVKTKDSAQKVVALDVMTICTISLLALLSITYKQSFYLDIAFVFALISFIGIIVFARFYALQYRGENA